MLMGLSSCLAAASAVSIAVAESIPAAPQRRVERAVSFKTSDGWTIAAKYRPARGDRATLVLAHGVGSAAGEWDRFAERLALEDVGTLAIDLRGHAGSRRGPSGKSDFKSFDANGEWPRVVGDLRAAAAWLKIQGVPAGRVAFGGASIGANLASAAAGKSAPFLLLLSPGADYRGVLLIATPGLKTLAAASRGDRYAFDAARELEDRGLATTVYAPAGHGVQMFNDPSTLDRIASWVVSASHP